MSENRRNYVRIQAEVGLVWRRLDAIELRDMDTTFKVRSRTVGLVSEISHSTEALTPAMRKISGDHPEVASCLKFLQGAVEALAEQIAQTEDNKTRTIPQQVVISAIGLEFRCGEVLSAGEPLEVIIELLPSRSRIMVIGEVVRNTEDSADVSVGDVALEFTHIRDADQELLIRHIHRAQLDELQRARSDRKVA